MFPLTRPFQRLNSQKRLRLDAHYKLPFRLPGQLRIHIRGFLTVQYSKNCNTIRHISAWTVGRGPMQGKDQETHTLLRSRLHMGSRVMHKSRKVMRVLHLESTTIQPKATYRAEIQPSHLTKNLYDHPGEAQLVLIGKRAQGCHGHTLQSPDELLPSHQVERLTPQT
jgi:hypothetical protein